MTYPPRQPQFRTGKRAELTADERRKVWALVDRFGNQKLAMAHLGVSSVVWYELTALGGSVTFKVAERVRARL